LADDGAVVSSEFHCAIISRLKNADMSEFV
jgi:hypothetical protein